VKKKYKIYYHLIQHLTFYSPKEVKMLMLNQIKFKEEGKPAFVFQNSYIFRAVINAHIIGCINYSSLQIKGLCCL